MASWPASKAPGNLFASADFNGIIDNVPRKALSMEGAGIHYTAGNVVHADASGFLAGTDAIDIDTGVTRVKVNQPLVLDEHATDDVSLTADVQASVFVKGGKLIVKYNDASTVRYKYLDLTGVGVTWVHSLTLP